MNEATIAAILLSIAALLTSVLTPLVTYLVQRKTKHDNKNTDAGTEKSSAETSEVYERVTARTVLQLENRDMRIVDLKEKFDALKKDFDELKQKLIMYENWNTRLQAQVISLDGVPVPMITSHVKKEDK